MSTTAYLLQQYLLGPGIGLRFQGRRSFQWEAIQSALDELGLQPDVVGRQMSAALRQALQAMFVRGAGEGGEPRESEDSLTLLGQVDAFVDPELVTRGAILDTLGALDGVRTEAEFKTQLLYTQSLLERSIRELCPEGSPLAGRGATLLDGFLHFAGEQQRASESLRSVLSILDDSGTTLQSRIREGSAADAAAFREEIPGVKDALRAAIDADDLDGAQARLDRLRELRSELERVEAEVEPLVAWAGELARILKHLEDRRGQFREEFGEVLDDLEGRATRALASREEWARQSSQIAAPDPEPEPGATEELAIRSVTKVLRRSDALRRRTESQGRIAPEDEEPQAPEPPPGADSASADPAELVRAGNEAFQARNFEAAARAYDRAIELDPAGATAHFNLFQVRVQQFKLADGFACYRRAVSIDPGLALAPPDYRIEGILGSGPKGLVFEVSRQGTEGRTALRLLKTSITGNAAPLSRLQKGLQTIRRLEHSAIVRPLRLFSHGGRYLVETERLEGRTLRRLLNLRGVIPLETALFYARQIGEALAEAHLEGAVHGDLKPGNVYEEVGQRIRIADWGLIQLRDTARVAQTTESFPRTYMPPEQKSGAVLDERCDVYSLALILYEMVVGERPTPDLPPPSELDDRVPEEFDELIARGAHKDPAERFDSMEEFVEALDAFRSETFTSSPDVISLGPEIEVEGGEESALESPVLVRARKTPRGMVLVPEGPFRRGSEQKADEQPVRTIELGAYFIDLTPVTMAEYQRFVDETGHRVPFVNAPWAKAFNWKKGRHAREHQLHPVVLVSWYDAAAYAEWAGKRLPTEAEWEKAARGDDGRTYPWGEGIDRTRCNYKRMQGGTTPVGQFEKGKGPYGCLDMAGNVWEWCADWYDADAYRTAPARSPVGPKTGKERVLRGGAWDTTEEALTCTFRYHNPAHVQNPFIGFRCAKDA